MQILAFAVVIGIVVLIHELGHFVAARAAGVRVYEFAIGFGPRLFSKKVGHTVYALRALPLGGMVRFAGMDDTHAVGETISKGHPESFHSKTFFARAGIIAAGPVMNFVLALVILAGLFIVHGVPVTTIKEVLPGSPAEQAGFAAGDTVVSVDGKPVTSMEAFIMTVSPNWGRRLKVVVERQGREIAIDVTPVYDTQTKTGRIGIVLAAGARQEGLSGSLAGAGRHLWGIITITVSSFGRMLTGRLRADVAGPIGIAVVSAQAARAGISALLALVATISASLGLLNLLPIPILDGGWIAMMAFERIRGKALTVEAETMFRLVGLAVILLLIMYATFTDITKLLGGM